MFLYYWIKHAVLIVSWFLAEKFWARDCKHCQHGIVRYNLESGKPTAADAGSMKKLYCPNA